MFCYNFTKFVAPDKLQTEIWNFGMENVAYIDTIGAQISIYFNTELTSEQQAQLATIVANHSIQQETITAIIKSARGFGTEIIVEFATENVMLGITQDGMTGTVRRHCSEVIDCLITGSLYDAINEIKAIPVENRDSKYLTPERLTKFCNKIEDYLGIPRSTIT